MTNHLCVWRPTLPAILGAMLLTAGCASATRPRAESPHAERIQDSRPERIAAQRAGAPGELELEQSDERWGIEAARDRREADKQKNASTSKPPAATKSTTVAPAGTP
jgi:hypothetical protein